jgi:hypothetical protein
MRTSAERHQEETRTSLLSPLVGFVAVDCRNFFPVISHLFVVPEHRGQGHGYRLLGVAEKHINEVLGFPRATLHCPQDMVPFYLKAGYRREVVDELRVADLGGGEVLLQKPLVVWVVPPEAVGTEATTCCADCWDY